MTMNKYETKASIRDRDNFMEMLSAGISDVIINGTFLEEGQLMKRKK